MEGKQPLREISDSQQWTKTQMWLFISYYFIYFLIPFFYFFATINTIFFGEFNSRGGSSGGKIYVIIIPCIYAFVYMFGHFPKRNIDVLKMYIPYIVNIVLAFVLTGGNSIVVALTLHGFIQVVGMVDGAFLSHIVFDLKQILYHRGKKNRLIILLGVLIFLHLFLSFSFFKFIHLNSSYLSISTSELLISTLISIITIAFSHYKYVTKYVAKYEDKVLSL